jgi:large subunit ribosomal protein L15
MERALQKVVKKKKKRLGRGYGSGKGGHTVGRGQKGQKSRKKLGIKVRKSLLKRTPQLRGKTKFKPKTRPIELSLSDLNVFPAGSRVDLKKLVKKGTIKEREASRGVKILASGKLEKKLNVLLPVTKSAKKAIEKLGGKVLDND